MIFYEGRVFPVYQLVTPSPSNQSDETITRNIATELVSNENKFFNGAIVYGFPFNSNQALLLDRFLGGVNLAIHLKGSGEIGDYVPLLNYYEERGSLLEIEHNPEPSPNDIEDTRWSILSSLK